MDLFIRHKIVETVEGPEIILYIDPSRYEFAQELGEKVNTGLQQQNLQFQIQQYIRNRVAANVQAKVAKVMFGSILIATLTLNHQSASAVEASTNGSITQQSSDINILIDGKPTSYSQPPLIKNGVTYIPIRGVAESFGASVWWNGDSKTVGINKDDTKIAFTVGSTIANVNNERVNVPPSLQVNGTVMVPIRFVSTTLGLNVNWNAVTRTVSITSPTELQTHQVTNGETLWGLSQRYGVNVNDLKAANHLKNDNLSVGQMLTIPIQPTKQSGAMDTAVNQEQNQLKVIKYQVVSGDTLSKIARTYDISVDQIKKDNNLASDALFVGQFLDIKTTAGTGTNSVHLTVPSTYKVASGDSLSTIAKKFNLTVSDLRSLNQLSSDTIYVGQVLKLSNNNVTTTTEDDSNSNQTQSTGAPHVKFETHVIQQGDNMWNLSVKYGVPMTELLAANKMTQTSALSIGQKILIPVHSIPVQQTVSAKHGEYLDWWTEAQYVFGIGKVAKVTDFQTGKSFMVKRTIGANHADCEPLTATDAAIMKQVWGGTWSWKTRPVIVEVDGRKLAASMSAMPHDVQYITNNNFNGHFDIHFKNSTRHKDGKVDYDHQAKVKIAAGT